MWTPERPPSSSLAFFLSPETSPSSATEGEVRLDTTSAWRPPPSERARSFVQRSLEWIEHSLSRRALLWNVGSVTLLAAVLHLASVGAGVFRGLAPVDVSMWLVTGFAAWSAGLVIRTRAPARARTIAAVWLLVLVVAAAATSALRL